MGNVLGTAMFYVGNVWGRQAFDECLCSDGSWAHNPRNTDLNTCVGSRMAWHALPLYISCQVL